jgi:hypothetical protein
MDDDEGVEGDDDENDADGCDEGTEEGISVAEERVEVASPLDTSIPEDTIPAELSPAEGSSLDATESLPDTPSENTPTTPVVSLTDDTSVGTPAPLESSLTLDTDSPKLLDAAEDNDEDETVKSLPPAEKHSCIHW